MNLVSVILPVYNVEDYLSTCLDSILKQSYKELEIIVVDDGATDASGEIADAYTQKDSRVKVIHKENGGVASARNTGLKVAKGDFIVFVDPDDWVTEDHVEFLLKLQQKDNADMCMTLSLFTQRGEQQPRKICIKTITPEDAATMLLSPYIYVGSYGKLYRRKWLLENNIWQNENIYSGEGLHFTIKAAQYANCVTISNRKIYYYRRNVSKSATTLFNINMYLNNEYSLNLIRNEKIINYDKFEIMWRLFRTHLFISGILAIEINSSKEKYPKEYRYWMETIKNERRFLLASKIVPVKSKIRIFFASSMPMLWAILANIKRRKIFYKSV